MPADMKLVEYGKDEPLAGLLGTSRALYTLAVEHAIPLAPVGWGSADTETLSTVTTTLESEKSQQAEATAAKLLGTSTASESKAQLKALKRKIDLGLRRLYRKRSPAIADIPRDAWEAGKTLRNPADLSVYFVRIRPLLLKVGPALGALVGGIDVAAEAERLRTGLDTSEASQANAMSGLPAEALEVYEAKGRLLLLINDLIDAGRTAFADDPAQAARFNKKILEAARKKRPKKDEPK